MGLGSLIGLGTSAISGGKGGSASGGVSPEEAMLAAYQAQQSKLKHAAAFANTGTEMSTGLTMAQGGSNIGEAMSLSSIADQNAAQQNALNQAGQQQLASNQNFNQGAQDFSNQSGNTFNSPSNQPA